MTEIDWTFYYSILKEQERKIRRTVFFFQRCESEATDPGKEADDPNKSNVENSTQINPQSSLEK